MATREEIIKIDETTEMQFKDEAAKKVWDEIVEKNSHNPYGRCVVNYTRRWAKYMQTLIAEGKAVIEIAEQASYDANIEGITALMYGCAVSVLSQIWKYGEELRKWHNKDYGYEGDDVVKPAVLTIGVSE